MCKSRIFHLTFFCICDNCSRINLFYSCACNHLYIFLSETSHSRHKIIRNHSLTYAVCHLDKSSSCRSSGIMTHIFRRFYSNHSSSDNRCISAENRNFSAQYVICLNHSFLAFYRKYDRFCSCCKNYDIRILRFDHICICFCLIANLRTISVTFLQKIYDPF